MISVQLLQVAQAVVDLPKLPPFPYAMLYAKLGEMSWNFKTPCEIFITQKHVFS
jgi:hypothetical protein